MREHLTTAMETIGAGLLVTGVSLICLPVGLMVAGVILAAAGWLVSR